MTHKQGFRSLRSLQPCLSTRSLAKAASFPRCYGPEFIAQELRKWLGKVGTGVLYIEPGSPWENGYCESFNGKFRDECLNQNWFVDLRHAREVIEDWRVDYNTVRPHSSLGYQTPQEFAASVAARPASPPTPVVSIDPAWTNSHVQEPRSANL
jgi:transposase InsO family protein